MRRVTRELADLVPRTVLGLMRVLGLFLRKEARDYSGLRAGSLSYGFVLVKGLLETSFITHPFWVYLQN